MADHGQVLSIRLSSGTMDDLDRLVAIERDHARPGHKVTRSSLISLAIELYVTQRLRRSTRNITQPTESA